MLLCVTLPSKNLVQNQWKSRHLRGKGYILYADNVVSASMQHWVDVVWKLKRRWVRTGKKLLQSSFILYKLYFVLNHHRPTTARPDNDNTRKTAFIWECIPVSDSTIQKTDFTFVCYRSRALSRMRCDFDTFEEHFNGNKHNAHCVSFMNLGRDACLVSPLPNGDNEYVF